MTLRTHLFVLFAKKLSLSLSLCFSFSLASWPLAEEGYILRDPVDYCFYCHQIDVKAQKKRLIVHLSKTLFQFFFFNAHPSFFFGSHFSACQMKGLSGGLIIAERSSACLPSVSNVR